MDPNSCLCILSLTDGPKRSGPRRLPRSLYLIIWLLRQLQLFSTSIDDLLMARSGRHFCLAIGAKLWSRLSHGQKSWLASANIKPVIVAKPSDFDRLAQLNIAELKGLDCRVALIPETTTKLTDVAAGKQEQLLMQGRQWLVKNFPHQPHGFFYPQGAYDTSVLNYLREFHFDFGLTCHRGFNQPGCDPLQLKHIPLKLGLARILLAVARQTIVRSLRPNPKPAKAVRTN